MPISPQKHQLREMETNSTSSNVGRRLHTQIKERETQTGAEKEVTTSHGIDTAGKTAGDKQTGVRETWGRGTGKRNIEGAREVEEGEGIQPATVTPSGLQAKT